jgi:hypothetical protein
MEEVNCTFPLSWYSLTYTIDIFSWGQATSRNGSSQSPATTANDDATTGIKMPSQPLSHWKLYNMYLNLDDHIYYVSVCVCMYV